MNLLIIGINSLFKKVITHIYKPRNVSLSFNHGPSVWCLACQVKISVFSLWAHSELLQHLDKHYACLLSKQGFGSSYQ